MADGASEPAATPSSAGSAEPAGASSPPKLGSRIVVTWVELTVAGLLGGVLGTTVGGPPALVVYFATTLASVAILLYNINELVQRAVAHRLERATAPGKR